MFTRKTRSTKTSKYLGIPYYSTGILPLKTVVSFNFCDSDFVVGLSFFTAQLLLYLFTRFLVLHSPKSPAVSHRAQSGVVGTAAAVEDAAPTGSTIVPFTVPSLSLGPPSTTE
jgi:hypothetical protein